MPPSGSKRRKAAAAKKKKDQVSPTLIPSGSKVTSFNGGDDLKGKESDGGELSSPGSQDPIQSDGNEFTEEGVDKDSPPVRRIDSEKVNEEEDVGIVKVDEDEGSVEITRELKLNEVSESVGDLSVEVGKNSDGSSSSSSSSSSDEEKEVHIENTQMVLDSPEVGGVNEAIENSVECQVTAVVLEELVESADASQVASVVFEELVESVDAHQVPAAVSEEVVETADDSQVPAVVSDELVETADDSLVPTVVLEEVVFVSETPPVDKVYEDLVKPALSELKAVEDEDLPVTLPAVVSHGETSNTDTFTVKDEEDNVLPQSDTPIAVTRNGVGHHPKSPEIQDSFDNQTPLLQAPLSVQRTSWKGCCGLFEVFTGSR